jgi:DNA repair exonuclease SbcCD ATPase subunit
VKINQLELENVKRVRAVRMELAPNGLTIIGGKNNQGKTSVIDAIAWALGGDKYRPTEPQREGSVIPPTLRIVMSNGLVVEHLALNLPRFMNASGKENANLSDARKSTRDLQDESTAELEQNIANIEQLNIRVRANMDKDKQVGLHERLGSAQSVNGYRA